MSYFKGTYLGYLRPNNDEDGGVPPKNRSDEVKFSDLFLGKSRNVLHVLLCA